MPVVCGLATTAIKGTRLQTVDRIDLGPSGARGDRRFYLIDERDRMLNGKHLADLTTVVPDWREESSTLTLSFPDGGTVTGVIALGATVATRFFSRPREDRRVDGPWASALSEFLGQPLRLIATASAVDRGRRGAASLISRASLARLAEVGGRAGVDGRRFRMLIEVDGIDAHAEDGWVGARVRIGQAVVRWHGHVGRCLVTSRDPQTGVIDLPTLDLLGRYRRNELSTEPLPFGIYGEVLSPGPVAVGDSIELDG